MNLRPDNTCDVMLVDALNLVFRIYWGMGATLSSGGQDTGIVYSVVRSVNSLIKNFYPKSMVFCWDGKDSKQRRKEIYPPYKEGREKLEKSELDSIFSQVELVQEFLGYAGIGSLKVDGWEADDVMTAIADWIEETGGISCIVTSDKDLQQVITPSIYWHDPMSNKFFTYETFVEKFGYTPEKVVDYKVLVGDSSDNIEGVKGIGKATATSLIQEYGTIDNFISAGNFTGRTKVLGTEETQILTRTTRDIIDIRYMVERDGFETEAVIEEWYSQPVKADEKALYDFLLRWGMQSLYGEDSFKELTDVLSTFKTVEVLDAIF